MPAPESGPRSLSEWLTRLRPLQPPADPAVRAAALEELSGGLGSAASLAQILLADPALVLLLFGAANRALARYDRVAHTLEHAISLLGATRLQTLLEQVPTLSADHPDAAAYRRAQLRSLHAAWQARLWAEGSGRWPAEEVFWSSLLAAAPVWPLWLEAGPAMLALEQLRARQGAVSAAQEQQLLGCRLAELGAALATAWQLPEMSVLAWQPSAAGTPRQWLQLDRAARLDDPPVVPDGPVNELCHHPALVVAVANALAEEADWDWYSPRCLRLLRIAASACRRSLATLTAYSHQTAAALSRDYADCGLPLPAARLLGHWRQAEFWFPPAPPVRAAAPAADEQLLVAALKRLREPGAITSPRAALELVATALQRGLGLQRVAVLLYRAGSRELHTGFSLGADTAPALQQLRFATQDNALLTQLLGKPVCLRLGADNRAKFWPHLPAPLRAAATGEALLLMAVFAGARPLAMLYADNGSGAAPNDRQHQLFRQLCQQLSACLTALTGQAPAAP